MVKNPNDNTAHIYDEVNQPLKGHDVLSAELGLITKLIGNGGSVLDIGCGTGRHMIPLLKIGLDVKGVDSSSRMLQAMKFKNKKVNVINNDVLKSDLGNNQYDLVIMMWNSFNEIALKKFQALKLLTKVKSALKKGGKVLINIDDPEKLDLANLRFQTHSKDQSRRFFQTWEVISLKKSTNTTLSRESIELQHMLSGEVQTFVSKIRQRWWSRDQVEDILIKAGFKTQCKSLSVNDELYIVGSL